MSISFGLGTNLSTSQKLTPQMQQAIRLLQLSSLELEQEVQAKLDSNPLLERVEEEGVSADAFSESLDGAYDEVRESSDYNNDNDYGYEGDFDAGLDNDFTDTYEADLTGDGLGEHHLAASNSANNASNNTTSTTTSNNEDNHSGDHDNIYDILSQDSYLDSHSGKALDRLGELSVDTDWDDIYTHSAEPTGLARPDMSDFDDYQGATQASLQDHVRWQLNFKHLSAIDLLIADYLIDAMDERGFIELDSEELAQSLGVMASFYQWEDTIDIDQINMVRHVIQSCEPLGVGASNLAECLQIQLRKLPKDTAYRDDAIRLLYGHDLLVSNNISALTTQTGVKKSDIADCLALIRTLNPNPALSFTASQPDYGLEPDSYDIPDVLVSLIDEANGDDPTWQVRLNPDTLPKLKVNQEYASLIKRGDDSPDNVYLKDHLTDARLFIRSIEERNQNLLKVATCIIQKQQAFLLEGATAMKPMILRDIADEVDLHESTVSRLTTSKTILTPQGLFSLKHFFSSHVSGSDGDVSSTAICAMIESLIKAENPKKPLSDSAIQKYLADEGIDIARRTVAKYREAMNIGSSTQRKQKF